MTPKKLKRKKEIKKKQNIAKYNTPKVKEPEYLEKSDGQGGWFKFPNPMYGVKINER